MLKRRKTEKGKGKSAESHTLVFIQTYKIIASEIGAFHFLDLQKIILPLSHKLQAFSSHFQI